MEVTIPSPVDPGTRPLVRPEADRHNILGDTMSILYLYLLISLAVLHWLVRVRVRRLERRFSAVAADADTLLKKSSYKAGNGTRPDPYQSAKQQFQLARLAMKRDRIEARYASWQSFSERFGQLRRRLAGYRGKVLPYLVGACDVAGIAVVLNQVGISVGQLRSMLGI
jgi:hypothetical protein